MEYFDTQPDEKLKNYYDFEKGYMGFEGLETPEIEEPPAIKATTGFMPEYIDKNKDSFLKFLIDKPKVEKKEDPLSMTGQKLEVDDDLDYSYVDTKSMLEASNKQTNTPEWIWNPRGSATFKGTNKPLDFNIFESEIRRKESDGKAWADNPNSSAVGYYQFLWGSWGKEISRVTGIKSSEEFKKRPDMQKKFFKYYYNNYVTPAVTRIKSKVGNAGLGDFDIAQLVHFRGEGGARKVLANNELNKKHEGYNPSPLQYINR